MIAKKIVIFLQLLKGEYSFELTHRSMRRCSSSIAVPSSMLHPAAYCISSSLFTKHTLTRAIRSEEPRLFTIARTLLILRETQQENEKPKRNSSTRRATRFSTPCLKLDSRLTSRGNNHVRRVSIICTKLNRENNRYYESQSIGKHIVRLLALFCTLDTDSRVKNCLLSREKNT